MRFPIALMVLALAMPVLAQGGKQPDESEKKRNDLAGQPAPAIKAVKILNGPEEFSLDAYKGKVVVLDFWATWCPPCRMVVPDMVKMQEKHGKEGLQVVGVTRYYGYGMDFNEPGMDLPHGGKRVGGRKAEEKLSEADEVKVNENFIKAFGVNYPIVFAEPETNPTYGIRGIPTVFVIGRDGKVLGHVVGAGEASHKKLEELVKQALATKADGADDAKRG